MLKWPPESMLGLVQPLAVYLRVRLKKEDGFLKTIFQGVIPVKGTKRLRNMSVERQSVVQGLMYHLLCKAQNIYIILMPRATIV